MEEVLFLLLLDDDDDALSLMQLKTCCSLALCSQSAQSFLTFAFV
ncbi:hypothetical protein PC123_g21829 [Phytophthora cactorum]|nr:hypothetical protein PC120_g20511 [Phytophthora cactorum]KAG4042686.1 hypothetical protein PC123_g21829 [Phytophthora cactorum]